MKKNFSIYTANYTQIKILEKNNILPVSISIFPPKYIDNIQKFKQLAPSEDILKKHKDSKKTNIDRENYISRFKKEILFSEDSKQLLLLEKDIASFINSIDKHIYDGIALLCFENAHDFCHRQIVAEFFENASSNLITELNCNIFNMTENECQKVIVNEFGYENYKRDYGTFRIINHNIHNIAIIGSRTFKNYGLLEKTVLEYMDQNNLDKKNTCIVSGGANGADSLGSDFADNHQLEKDIYFADWNGPKGKGAGFARNYEIVNHSDIIIAFTNGSNGTQHSINYAKKQGIEVLEVGFLNENKIPKLNCRFIKKITPSFIQNHPNDIIVFGDNILEKGKGGQAKVCRDKTNCFGIATKREPSMKDTSFFSDKEDELDLVKIQLRKLYTKGLSGTTIWFPLDGIGTGLADLENKSPKIRLFIDSILVEHFFENSIILENSFLNEIKLNDNNKVEEKKSPTIWQDLEF